MSVIKYIRSIANLNEHESQWFYSIKHDGFKCNPCFISYLSSRSSFSVLFCGLDDWHETNYGRWWGWTKHACWIINLCEDIIVIVWSSSGLFSATLLFWQRSRFFIKALIMFLNSHIFLRNVFFSTWKPRTLLVNHDLWCTFEPKLSFGMFCAFTGVSEVLSSVVEDIGEAVTRNISGAQILHELLSAPWLHALLKVSGLKVPQKTCWSVSLHTDHMFMSVSDLWVPHPVPEDETKPLSALCLRTLIWGW